MEKNLTKNRIIIAALFVIVIVLAMATIGLTYAWFTDRETSESQVIKFGKIDIVLNNAGLFQSTNEAIVEDIMPGDQLKLKYSFSNAEDSEDSYCLAYIDISSDDIVGSAFEDFGALSGYYAGTTKTSESNKTCVELTDSVTELSYELPFEIPSSLTNDFADKEIRIVLTVMAIQKANMRGETENEKKANAYDLLVIEYENGLHTPGLTFELNEGEESYSVSGYTGSATTVNIYSRYNGMPVTTIAADAFKDTTVSKVYMQDGITTISDGALYNSTLTEFVWPKTMTSFAAAALNMTDLEAIFMQDKLRVYYTGTFEYLLNDVQTNVGAQMFTELMYQYNMIAEQNSLSAVGYIYSETKPTSEMRSYTIEGETVPLYYWHYQNGVPSVWEFERVELENGLIIEENGTGWSVVGYNGSATEITIPESHEGVTINKVDTMLANTSLNRISIGSGVGFTNKFFPTTNVAWKDSFEYVLFAEDAIDSVWNIYLALGEIALSGGDTGDQVIKDKFVCSFGFDEWNALMERNSELYGNSGGTVEYAALFLAVWSGSPLLYSELEPTIEMNAVNWNTCDGSGVLYTYWHYVDGNITTWQLNVLNYDSSSDCYFAYIDSNRNSYAVVDGSGKNVTTLKIPETYKGLPVTTIYKGAFWNSTFNSIIIPSSVTTIMDSAFFNSSGVTKVYYSGADATAWSQIQIETNNDRLTNATRYYYSETSKAGCWHYVDNVPTLW